MDIGKPCFMGSGEKGKFEPCFFDGLNPLICIQMFGIENLMIRYWVYSVAGCSCLAVFFIVKNMEIIMKYCP